MKGENRCAAEQFSKNAILQSSTLKWFFILIITFWKHQVFSFIEFVVKPLKNRCSFLVKPLAQEQFSQKYIYGTHFRGFFESYFQLQLLGHYQKFSKFLMPSFYHIGNQGLELRRKNPLTDSQMTDTPEAKSFLLTGVRELVSIRIGKNSFTCNRFL